MHSKQVKRSIISSMFLRAYRLCSPRFLEDEIQKVYNIFKNLEYDVSFIDDAHKRAKSNYFNTAVPRSFNNEGKSILCLPYAKEFCCLPSVLYNTDYKLVFSYPNTSNRFLIRNKPSSNINAGVYKIPCKDCDKVYWGETGRSCAVRQKEHMRDVRNCNLSNALFNHKIECDHRIDWDGTQIVFKSGSYFKRRIVESTLIATYPCFNLSEGHFKINKSFRNQILNCLPPSAVR